MNRDRWLLLAGVAVALLVVGVTAWKAGVKAKAADARQTYCAEVATLHVPKCPPERDVAVLGDWGDGQTASVQWTGSHWVLRLPGMYDVVRAPHDWAPLPSVGSSR